MFMETKAEGASPVSAPLETTQVPTFLALPPWLGPLAWGVSGVAQASWLMWAWQIVTSGTGDFDFSTYYAAARALRLDQHANIYGAAVLAANGAAGHVFLQPPLPFTYPPLAAIIVEPLTVVPFVEATHVWLAINLTAWFLCTLVLAGEAYVLLRPVLAPTRAPAQSSENRRWWHEPALPLALVLATLVCLSERPAAQTLTLGQINFLVALPLTLVPRLLRHGRDGWAGGAIAFAAMLKITPILLLVYLMLRARQRAVIGALMTLAVLILFCLVVVGPADLLATIPQALQVGGADANLPQNEALFAVPLRVVHVMVPSLTTIAHVMSLGCLIIVACAIGVILRQKHSGDMRARDMNADTLGYALALCGMVLVVPTVWAHHYVWLLPSLVLTLAWGLRTIFQHAGASPSDRHRAAIQFGASIVAWLVIAYTLPFDLDFHPFLRATVVLGISLTDWSHWLRPLATVLLAGVLTSYLWSHRSTITLADATSAAHASRV